MIDSLRVELKEQPFNIAVVKIRPRHYFTTIQSDWANGFERNFEAASLPIQELYGGSSFGTHLDKTLSSTMMVEEAGDGESMAVGRMGQPQHEVDVLKGIISEKDLNRLEPYYWLGKDAHTTWKALHHLL